MDHHHNGATLAFPLRAPGFPAAASTMGVTVGAAHPHQPWPGIAFLAEAISWQDMYMNELMTKQHDECSTPNIHMTNLIELLALTATTNA